MCAILDNYDREGLFFLPFFTMSHFFRLCHPFFDSVKKPSPMSFRAGTLPMVGDLLKVSRKSAKSQRKIPSVF